MSSDFRFWILDFGFAVASKNAIVFQKVSKKTFQLEMISFIYETNLKSKI